MCHDRDRPMRIGLQCRTAINPRTSLISIADDQATALRPTSPKRENESTGEFLTVTLRVPRPTSPPEPAKPKPKVDTRTRCRLSLLVRPGFTLLYFTLGGGLGGMRSEHSSPAWSRSPSPTSSHPSKYTASDCGSEGGSVVDDGDPMEAFPPLPSAPPRPTRTPARTSAHAPMSCDAWSPPATRRTPLPMGTCPECHTRFDHKPDCSKNPAKN